MSLPLVTRFGADPIQDLEVANKRYVDNTSGGDSIMAHSLASNIGNGSFSSWAQVGSWNSCETCRSTVMPRAGTFTLYTVGLRVNSNTTDGANLRTRTNVANANLIVTVDQATGSFQDITNSDTIANLDEVSQEYNFGDGTVQSFSESIVFTPT